MNPHLARAQLLLEQSRYDLAEAELRQALGLEPHEAGAHALLAICLSERKQFQEGTEEARQAIHLAPDLAFAHYSLAYVLQERERIDEAITAIHEAIQLDPEDADYLALLAQLLINRKEWRKALEAAERGLQFTPDHVACTNLRAIALVKLGRKEEAGKTIDAALARNPDNPVSHANQGWTFLERNDPGKALEHFREALRLDPENEWARRGIIEALKARHFIYSLMLRYFLFMAKLSGKAQWMIVLGGYFGYRFLTGVSRTHPEWARWILPVQCLYIVFALLTWIADPLFNLLLRLNRFGRLALSGEQINASNWIGGCLGLALAAAILWLIAGVDTFYYVGSFVFGFLAIPMAGVFKCRPGWPRRIMATYTTVVALLGVGAIALLLNSGMLGNPKGNFDGNSSAETGLALLGYYAIGVVCGGWVANILIMQRPKN